MTTACFIVTGYNNTRIYDVGKLRDICRVEYRAKLVLVTEQARPQDRAAADELIVAPLGAVGPGAVESVVDELACRDLHPIGILPFSDRGVPMGAHLAAHFSLPGAAPTEATAGFDKQRFRELESATTTHPTGYVPLRSVPVGSLSQFESAVEQFGGTAFVKPTSEGNSRGCQVVNDIAACRDIWTALAPYHGSGVIVETLVRNAREYSWDFVGGSRWLTEKHTTQDRFRAEIQQIVPAPLDPQEAARLDLAGEHMRQLVSPGNGAFHNELFLMRDGVAAVETNMRPGGMHIWDLARLAFADLDPWREWLRWSTTGELRPAQPRAHAVSGIRMLRAARDGVLTSLPDVAELAESLDIPVHQAAFTKSPSDPVSSDVADNSGFVGQIILVGDDSKTLLDRLDRLSAAIEARIVIRQARPH